MVGHGRSRFSCRGQGNSLLALCLPAGARERRATHEAHDIRLLAIITWRLELLPSWLCEPLWTGMEHLRNRKERKKRIVRFSGIILRLGDGIL
jgi:hypothetical protein